MRISKRSFRAPRARNLLLKKVRRVIAVCLVLLWMPPAFSDGPTPEIEKEKAALLEMMAFVSELEGSQIPALKAVRNKAEALIERLRSKEDPSRKKDAELIDQKILKPIDALINMGSLLEACGRGEEPILSGLGRQFVRAMVERINIGECRDLQAIATPPEMMMLARNVSQIEEAILRGKPRPKKVDDSKLFKKILEKSRDMAIVSYFKEYSKLQGEIHFDPFGDPVKVTQESADAYFRITGENIFEPETFKSFFFLSQEKRGVGVPLSEIHQARREEFMRSQKSSYEEFIQENREAYRQEVEGALRELSHLRLSKEFQNARWALPPAARNRIEGVRPSPEMPPSPVARLEEGERLWLDYLFEKGVDLDSLYARDLGYGRPDDFESGDKFELFLNEALGPQAFSQLDNYLDSELKSIRERAKSHRVTLDSDALAQLIQKGLAQVKRVDEEGKSIPAWEAAKEELPYLRARHEVLKRNIYRDFMAVRHDPNIEKMWGDDKAGSISLDSVTEAWQKYDASIQKFLKETLPSLKEEGEKDPKKQIKLALKYHPSAVLGALLDDPRIEVAKRICQLGDEIKVDELEEEASRLTWGLGATLAVGASAALTYGMGPLFGYGLGFGAYGDAIFAGTATAVGGGHMLWKSIPDYQALAYEGEVMEDILLALGEGDPRSVADKMGEINARFAELIGEGFLNAVGGLAFIKAARNIPASLRAEAIRRELESLGRIRQGLRRIAEENVEKGVVRDFDKLVDGKNPVHALSDDGRIAYGEKVLGYKPGVIKNTPELRDALLDAHNFNEAKLGEELLGRGRSLSEFGDNDIRFMVIAGKAKRLKPFDPSKRRALMENGIVGNEAFLKGGSPRELENTLAGLDKGAGELAPVRARDTDVFMIQLGQKGVPSNPKAAVVFRYLEKGRSYEVTLLDGRKFRAILKEGREEGDDLALAFQEPEMGKIHGIGPEDIRTIEEIKPGVEHSLVSPEVPIPPSSIASELPKPPSPAARPPAEVPMAPPQRVPSKTIDEVHMFKPPVTIRYLEPRLFGLLNPKVVEIRAVPKDLPVLFIDNEGFATPGFVVKSTEGSGTALRTGVTFVRGGSSSIEMNMERIAKVEPVLVTPKRIYLRSKEIDPKVGDVVFYKGEGGGYRPALVIHKGSPTGGQGREQLVLGYLDPATGEIIEVSHIGLKGAISGTNRITTGEILVPEGSSLRGLPEVKSPPPIKSPPGGKLDLPREHGAPRFAQESGEDIIQIGGVKIRKGGVYTVKLGDDEFRGAYVGKIVTKDGKIIYYFDDGTNDVGRAIEAGMINSITKHSN